MCRRLVEVWRVSFEQRKACSGALRTGSRASEAILWQSLNQC